MSYFIFAKNLPFLLSVVAIKKDALMYAVQCRRQRIVRPFRTSWAKT